MFGPAIIRRMVPFVETPGAKILKLGTLMKKIVIAAALLMISASAHAGTYSYEGVTIHMQDGCRSSSCVSVYAPGYGAYHGGKQMKVRKARKDAARVASAKKEDAAVNRASTAATPAVQTAPDAAPSAATSDATGQ
jgi:hypothetical protein